MKSLTNMAIGLLLSGVCVTASAVWEMTPEQIIAAAEAAEAACKDIEPEATERGRQLLAKGLTEEQRKDLPNIRKTEIYKKTFREQSEWFASLNKEERHHACQHAW